MPIVDYKAQAQKLEEALFKNSSISDKNKRLMKKFLACYSVSDARREIFLRHIQKFLCCTKDAERDMHDRDKINWIFKKFRDTLSPNYYSTIVNVSSRFVRWLNEGEKPAGFKDIQKVSKKQQKRKLTPNDMLNWDDGLKFISLTNNIQLKAIIATQLDGGFRPSEFVDLSYGDVAVKKDFIAVNVQDGKTGPRIVILWRAVPYLAHWLRNHPTKRKDDPLWVQEFQASHTIMKYRYPAMLKRIRELGKKINFKKPLDFYNIRHSACTMSKKDNVPDELAAAKFGHSVDYYVNTYGRLSPDDVLSRYSRHYGIAVEEAKPQKNVTCPRCDFINPPDSKLCEKCGAATDAKLAFELADESTQVRDELQSVKAQLDRINSFMNRLVEQNPDVLEILAQKALRVKDNDKNT